jgi:ribosomal protein S27E
METPNEVAAVAVVLPKAKANGRLTIEGLKAKYPHIDVGQGLGWDAAANKQFVHIGCVDCGSDRKVFTSDLWQISRCAICTKAARKVARAAKRVAEIKALADAKAILASQPA